MEVANRAYRGVEKGLLLNTICELFNERVCKNLACDAFDLEARGLRLQTICERQREVLALAYRGYIGESNFAQRILNRLALRIEDRCL